MSFDYTCLTRYTYLFLHAYCEEISKDLCCPNCKSGLRLCLQYEQYNSDYDCVCVLALNNLITVYSIISQLP